MSKTNPWERQVLTHYLAPTAPIVGEHQIVLRLELPMMSCVISERDSNKEGAGQGPWQNIDGMFGSMLRGLLWGSASYSRREHLCLYSGTPAELPTHCQGVSSPLRQNSWLTSWWEFLYWMVGFCCCQEEIKSSLEHFAWQQLREGAVCSPRKGSPLSLFAVVFEGMAGCFRSQVTKAKDHLTDGRYQWNMGSLSFPGACVPWI